MLRLQIISLAVSVLGAAVMPNVGFQSRTNETRAARVHLTSAPPKAGLVDDDTVGFAKSRKSQPQNDDFSAVGDSWGDTVDQRLDELERKVALCPCSNAAEGKAPAVAGSTTIKEAVVRSDMKPQEVADALVKLGFKSTAPSAAPVVQTFYAGGGSTGSYSGGSSGSSTVMASSPTTTWQTSSYAVPATSYWVPQVATPVSGVSYSYSTAAPRRVLRANSAQTCRLMNGQWVCQ